VALGGPFVVLLGEDGADEADHGRFVREDLHDVRASFSLLSRSRGLFDQTLRQCWGGNAVNASTLVFAAVMSSATLENCLLRRRTVSSHAVATLVASGA
jgi:hypothetical protein